MSSRQDPEGDASLIIAHSDKITFFWLRGQIAPRHKKSVTDEILSNATITINTSAKLSNGDVDSGPPLVFPLKTIARSSLIGHFAIRDEDGRYVDHLTVEGQNDLLADNVFMGMFTKPGEYTFEVVARLHDETCLFAVSLTQWLDGEVRR